MGSPMDDEMHAGELVDTDAVYSVGRMKGFLLAGREIEKAFVLSEVQQLLGHCRQDFEDVLLPVICKQCSRNWNDDLKFKSAQALSYVVAAPIKAASAVKIVNCCAEVLQRGTSLSGTDSVFFYQVWSGILVEAMQVESAKFEQDVVNKLSGLAQKQAESPKMEHRKSAARIYGALAVPCSATSCEQVLLPALLRLFSHKEVVVLGTAIESTVEITNKLPIDVVEQSVWPKLIKYTAAKDVRIKCTALRTLAAIVDNLRKKAPEGSLLPQGMVDTIVALLKVEAVYLKTDAKQDLRSIGDDVYMVLEVETEVLGELVYAARESMDHAVLKSVFKACAVSATCNGPLLRRNFAYNFPGLCLAMCGRYGNMGSIFTLLGRDRDDEVRYNVSAGVHEVVKVLLGDPKADRAVVCKTLMALFDDDNLGVLSNVFERLNDIVQLLHQAGESEQLKALVMNIEKEKIEGSWRLQEVICQQLKGCVSFVDEPTIVERVLPLTWELIHDGMPLVRRAAAHTVVHSVRYIPDMGVARPCVAMYYEGLGSSSNPYRVRLALVEAALEALEVFSSQYFREHLAAPVLALATDAVSNVRVKLATNLHKLQPVCAGLAEFQTALKQLHDDEDPEVKVAMAQYPARAAEEGSNAAGIGPKAADKMKLESEAKFFHQAAQEKALAPRQPKPMPRVASAEFRAAPAPKPTDTRRSSSFTAKTAEGTPEMGAFQKSDGGGRLEQEAFRRLPASGNTRSTETSQEPSSPRNLQAPAPEPGAKRGGKGANRGQPPFGRGGLLGLGLFGQRKP